MNLFLSIVGCSILGLLLMMLGPLFGGILAFGIVTGVLFRSLYILHDLRSKLLKDFPKPNKSRQVLEEYIKERDSGEQAPH